MSGIAYCFFTDKEDIDYTIFCLISVCTPTEQQPIDYSCIQLLALGNEHVKTHEKDNEQKSAHNIY